MRPLTLERPKPLLEVRGTALIAWHLERLANVGIGDVVVNVSWLGEKIEHYCGDGRRWGIRIHYSRESEPLETAGGIVRALPLLGPDPFLVVNADIFTDYAFGNLANHVLGAGEARLVLVPNPLHNERGDFTLDGHRVTLRGGSTLTYAGIGLYDPHFFDGCVPGKRPLLPLLESAISESRLAGECYRGLWVDVGTRERLEALNKL